MKQGLARQPRKGDGHTGLPWKEVPAFVQALRSSPYAPSVRLGLQFVILTAARTSEVRLATWDEIDLDKAVWTVPGERMKAGKTHRVPLSTAALAVLADARREWDGESPYIFPSRGKHLSQDAFRMATLRLIRDDGKVHGFRKSFKNWVSDHQLNREAAEAALAHALGKVEGAYRTTDLLEARRPLMEAWGEFVTGGR